MPKIVAFISDNPEFYNYVFGSSDATGQIVLKIGGDLEQVVKKFGLNQISNGMYGNNDTLCVERNVSIDELPNVRREIQEYIKHANTKD